MNEQLDEAQQLIHKLFDHKDKFKNYLLSSSTAASAIEATAPPAAAATAAQSTTNAGGGVTALKKSLAGNKKGIITRSSNLKSSLVAKSSS